MHAATKHTLADGFVDNDTALIDSTLSGNHAAYAELMARYQDRLYASMLSIAHSAELAEEIVHVTFVQAFMKLSTFRRNAAFSTWLFRIAYNKFVSLKRAKRVKTVQSHFDDKWQIDTVDPGDSPERVCVRAEEVKSLHDALERLDADTRTILVLRELEELSYEEISEALEMKLGTVRSKLSRARNKLLRELSRDGAGVC